MDSDEIDVVDILAYSSDELLKEFLKTKNDAEHTKMIENYLGKVGKSAIEAIDDFQNDLDWFNVTEPIHLSDLKGKIVILDFFTYCCINCVHILPDLKTMEKLFPPEAGLVVIGVHSAKFDNEKDSSNLLSAIQRYKITHPVVNDINSKMWTQLRIKCWPTLLVISPTGNPLLVLMGEGHGTFLKKFVEISISFFEKREELKSCLLPISPSTDLIRTSHLRFPSKICCRFIPKHGDELIAVSDSGNNRILLLNSNGDVLEKIGGFEAGFINGNFEIARFNSPQGLSFLNDDVLVVADTGNHAVRTIHIKSKEVLTIAGNGVQGTDKVGGLLGSKQSLSSPWDLVVFKTKDMDMSFHVDENSVTEKDVILVAMAGTHQIWAIFLDGIIWWKFRRYEPHTCAVIVGNGSEENRNNSYPQNAAFAQPSGLALDKDNLFVADSESSSIRKVTMIDGKVTGVVGGDRNPLNLFAFGDRDGRQFNAKLQHPLGVCYNNSDEFLYVADTYNHKIKRVDTKTNIIETCLIRDKNNSDIFQFSEPDGICCDSRGKYLYIVDTNNHAIQIVDIENMVTWPLNLNFNHKSLVNLQVDNMETLQKTIKTKSKSTVFLKINFSYNDGIKPTENAPQKWRLVMQNERISAEYTSGSIIDNSFAVTLHINFSEVTEEDVLLYCSINICNDNVCMHKEFRTKIKFVYDMKLIADTNENLNFFVELERVCIVEK